MTAMGRGDLHQPQRALDRPRDGVVATLGPEGTDAHAEALRHFGQVVLTKTFDAAVRSAYESDTYALVAAGFVERTGHDVSDMWVNIHFRNLDRMHLHDVWVSPTKQMCLATRRTGRPDTARSIALHPATQVFADAFAPAEARRQYVDAKPVAVRLVADGQADCCIASVDIAERHGLRIHHVFQPTMVWCLYGPLPDREKT